MRVFVSSVMRGFDPYRQAVGEAIESLGYTVVRAEDFGARADTPQRACLEAARSADLTVVVLGTRYGEPQESGLSATHEEFREARDHGAVAVFTEQGIDPEPAQAAFIEEAREWTTGRPTATFRNPSDLRAKVTRTLHEHALRMEAGAVDPADLAARARSLLPRRSHGSASRTHLVVVGGPAHDVLSPAQLEEPEFTHRVMQRALFGPDSVFDPSDGTSSRVSDDRLMLEQDSAVIHITEDGSVMVAAPAVQGDRQAWQGLSALIEEDVRDSLAGALAFAAWLLDEIDPLHRLSDVVVLAAIAGGSALGWRTRSEHVASPHRMTMPLRGSDFVVVPEQPRAYPRAAIGAGRPGIVDDLLVRLRREFRT